MKKIILASVSIILFFNHVIAQDFIKKKSGEIIKSKVVEVNTLDIKFKKFENLNGPVYTLLKSEIDSISYENGSTDVFIQANNLREDSTEINENLYLLGQKDAIKYYRGYESGGAITLATSLINPVLGLISVGIFSSQQPSSFNRKNPNSDLLKNPDYSDGYTQMAQKIQKRKMWINWGISSGVWIAGAILISVH